MLTVTRPRGGADLLAAADDPWTREWITPEWTGPAWAVQGAVAYGLGTPDEPTATVTVTGTAEAATELTAQVLSTLPEPPYVLTVPRGTGSLPDGEREEWALMTTAAAPPAQPGEEKVVPVPPGPEVAALLAEASPGHLVRPGDPQVAVWAGVPGPDGTPVCVGALLTRPGTGAPHLASIATAPAHRGRGLAAAVTAWLTRRALERAPGCSLARLDSARAAHRLYERLGYGTAQQFTSVTLDVW
ncbi:MULTISPECIES: GNAT family N-acetyltransferase [unclassified Streptomyces]|uniref:GNAT family N-acetyltransferase n=1 Tax=unclassified Streptomyces TaxID=2593676 RepID=UPI003D707692